MEYSITPTPITLEDPVWLYRDAFRSHSVYPTTLQLCLLPRTDRTLGFSPETTYLSWTYILCLPLLGTFLSHTVNSCTVCFIVHFTCHNQRTVISLLYWQVFFFFSLYFVNSWGLCRFVLYLGISRSIHSINS